MFNMKWSVISGGLAFIVSMIAGLLFGHVGFLTALLRGLFFFVLFFGIGAGVYALINAFLPELLNMDSQDSPASDVFGSAGAGSQVNITVDDSTLGAALPDSGFFSSESSDVGTFSDLVSKSAESGNKDVFSSGDIDQNQTSSYNSKGELPPAESKGGDFSMDFSTLTSGTEEAVEATEAIPKTESHTESYMDTFSSFTSESDTKENDSLFLEDKPDEGKTSVFEGDFKPKEIASGIRTVLEKDKKG